MKSNYSFNAELISNKKFTDIQIEKIKTEFESREDYNTFYQAFSDSMEINFGGYLEIYIENIFLDLDLSSDIEEIVKCLDADIQGGWSSDSKLEFSSILPQINYVWYKDGNEWKKSIVDSPREDFFTSEWDEEDQGDNFYTEDYSDNYSDWD